MRTGIFIGLVLWFPCPWYMVAVGALLPVIAMYGIVGGIVLVLSLVHLAVYAGILEQHWVTLPQGAVEFEKGSSG